MLLIFRILGSFVTRTKRFQRDARERVDIFYGYANFLMCFIKAWRAKGKIAGVISPYVYLTVRTRPANGYIRPRRAFV